MALWIILDLIVIAIYIICALYFKNKGFLKSSQTVISLILTLCLMTTALPFFEDIITNSAIGKGITQSVEDFIVSDDKNDDSTSHIIALPDFMQKTLDEQLLAIDTATDNVMAATAQQTSQLIIQAISTVLLFLLIKIGIFLLFKILEAFFRLAPLNFVNRTLGIILGLVNATIIVYVLCAVAVVAAPPEYSATLKEAISQTFITQLFYNNNILLQLFM